MPKYRFDIAIEVEAETAESAKWTLTNDIVNGGIHNRQYIAWLVEQAVIQDVTEGDNNERLI